MAINKTKPKLHAQIVHFKWHKKRINAKFITIVVEHHKQAKYSICKQNNYAKLTEIAYI